jgi:cold shock protein
VPAGRVRRFNQARGFGFIQPDEGGEDVFLHVRDLAQGESAEDLTDGTPVVYGVEQGEKGLRATGVRVLVNQELVRLAAQAIRSVNELAYALRRRGWDV